MQTLSYKIKKALAFVGLSLGLVASSHAANSAYVSFLSSQAAGMALPNYSTNVFGVTNLTTYFPVTNFNVVYGTNTTLVTNRFINPYLQAGNPGVTNSLLGTNTGLYYQSKLSYSTNSTGSITVGNAFQDVPMWADGLGDLSGNMAITIAVCGEHANVTNVATFTFLRSGDGQNFATGTGVADAFTVAVTANGTTQVVVTTNLPSVFMQGARVIRLQSIGLPTNSVALTTNLYINAVGIHGFRP